MMLDSAHLQVPFMADLVTLADPTSPYSFLNYLKATGRLYRFYIRENFYPLRAEFNAYCQWVAEQLPQRPLRPARHGGGARRTASTLVHTTARRRHARCMPAAGWSWAPEPSPYIPPACACRDRRRRPGAAQQRLPGPQGRAAVQRSITVVGSGQSAAEIFLRPAPGPAGPDGYELNWVTRSGRFFPLEYTKLTLEMTSPEYVDYFHALPEAPATGSSAPRKTSTRASTPS